MSLAGTWGHIYVYSNNITVHDNTRVSQVSFVVCSVWNVACLAFLLLSMAFLRQP